MAGMRKFRKGPQQPPDLDVTTFLNLMVVLIPFLLATAVFSQVAIQELNLPQAAAGGETPDKPLVTIEVMVRKDSLQIGNGKVITQTLPKQDGKYDLVQLSLQLRELKLRYPEKEDINVLMEPEIEYQDVIAVMDAVKVWRAPKAAPTAGADPASAPATPALPAEDFILFPEVSIGDAP